MEYILKPASIDNVDILVKHHLNTILEYAENLSLEEKNNIINYVKENTKRTIDDSKLIEVNDEVVGSFCVTKYKDGYLLDEIFIDLEYRNKGIGTSIVQKILLDYSLVYLWVYKNNKRAIEFYKKMGFSISDETETRYFMKYSKIEKAREFCSRVKELAKKYNLPFFIVTDGASAISNNGCEAVRNARENHIKWEEKNGFNPNEDWAKEK